ncbi:MAG TPA: tRNA(Met) cytidine acetyltransferase [Archaeoglobus profundus]|nr:tRNA(Met) cytidine acetyltransferase [Archaeoglobus profundus]
MTVRELIAEVENATKTAVENRHRFMVMICSKKADDRVFKLAKKVYKKYIEVLEGLKDKNEEDEKEMLIAGRSNFLEIAKKYFSGKFVNYKDSPSVLGETYSSLLIDFTMGFHPNDLGILIETIAEGGIIIALSPPIEVWDNLISKWHEELVSEPYTVNDVIPRFYRRFIKRTLEAEGIIIFDADKRKIVKKYEFKKVEEPREEIKIREEEKEISKKLYKLCATQDQVRVLELFEHYFDRKRDRKAVVITADRGRGKTAVLGIVTPYLIWRMYNVLKRPVRIIVVAPTPQAVQTFFKFLKKSLVRYGIKYKVKESNGLITVVNSKLARVEYVVPRRAMIEKDLADIIIVDEAAGIDVPVLWKISEGVRYLVFSTTIHGYEGAGRGFSIRFLRKLEEDETIEIEKIHLTEPIRYGKGDPIEKWLYDVLLLDAQPAELSEEDIEAIKNGKLEFEQIDKDKMFEDEKLLREFFGIYILAHYRNRPSDIVILSDMPNHLAFRVSVNGKTVCSLHVAIEGKIDEETIKKMAEGYKPRGQIIPDLILKHYWDYDFPKLVGVRIVRIATHPSVMKMGIGSFALQKIIEWAQAKDMDWVGSGFGVSPELLRFWIKNGFYPVHITPQRNEVSGEHTLVVIKPLKPDVYSRIEEINSNFMRRLIEYLCDELSDLEIETAIGLLRCLMKDIPMPKPEFGYIEKKRIKKYFHGMSLYEYVSDIIRPLVRYYYSRRDKVELNEEEEKLVVGKCLQLRPWKEFGNNFKVYKMLVKAIQKIWKWCYGEN